MEGLAMKSSHGMAAGLVVLWIHTKQGDEVAGTCVARRNIKSLHTLVPRVLSDWDMKYINTKQRPERK